ncbi:MAG: phage tail tube protein [Microbacterium sp.]
MTTSADCSIGYKAESTYGTGVTVDRFLEFNTEGLDFLPNRQTRRGMRVGRRTAISGRKITTTKQAGGPIETDIWTKGLGTLLQACTGTASSTVVSGATYQQLFTLGDSLNSLTVQKGIPRVGGTVDAYTFLGAMVDQFTISIPSDEAATLSVELDARDMTTGTAYATPSYVSSPNVYHWAHAAFTYGGTVTAPTTTALASGGTAAADIRDFELTVNNNLNKERWNGGLGGLKDKPTVGIREITGKFTAEYAARGYIDDFAADTERALVATLTSGEALSTGFATLQVVLPAIKLDGPGAVVANDGDLITVEHTFTAYDNLTAAQPIWIAVRTSDTNL